jgi:hypothetical protein
MEAEKPPPEVYEAVLAGPILEALVADLLALARVERVMEKGGARRQATESNDLAGAVERLLRGEIRAIQAWYLHGGAAWVDTLQARADGQVRLVRLRVASILH